MSLSSFPSMYVASLDSPSMYVVSLDSTSMYAVALDSPLNVCGRFRLSTQCMW